MGSPEKPPGIKKEKHAIVSIKDVKNDEWIENGNQFSVAGLNVTAHHAHVDGENAQTTSHDGVKRFQKFKQYKDLDMAICQKPSNSGASYKMAVPVIGEEVFVFGYNLEGPHDELHFSHGVVEELQEPYKNIKGALCHTCTTYPTMSGSPVINMKGQVVGMHIAGNDSGAQRNAFIAFTPQILADFGMGGSSNTP